MFDVLNWRDIAFAGVVPVHQGRGFHRALHLRLHCPGAKPSFAGSRISFDVTLGHAKKWECCLEAAPEIDGQMIGFNGDPHQPDSERAAAVAKRLLDADLFPDGGAHAFVAQSRLQPAVLSARPLWNTPPRD